MTETPNNPTDNGKHVDIDSILKRVKKLLNLSKSSNEHEAALAMENAQKLLVKYKLSMSQVQDAVLYRTEQIAEHTLSCPTDDLTFEAYASNLLNAICRNSFCRFFRKTRGRKNVAIVLIGKPTDVEIAKAQFMYILEQIERLSSGFKDFPEDMDSLDYNAIRGKRGQAASKERRDYACGISHRVTQRLKELRKQLETSSETTALVTTEDKQLGIFMQRYHLTYGRGAGYNANQSSFSKGIQAGNRISLNRQIK
jgi:ElaB/YqjD/DUF883 family membrane-anchored ribosome-binding protein